MDISSSMELISKLRGIQRRAINFGHNREDILDAIGWLINEIQAEADRMDREQDEAYREHLESLADYHSYLRDAS